MNLRLAFAISTAIEPDILIMDEMISAGDLPFIEKAKKRLHEVIGKASILALASHDLQMVKSLCNKALWLEHGAIKKIGPPDAVVAAYENCPMAQAPAP
jgi:ABC-type polysaccharide/polyol phosphate transport system ATPase subunit